jgi:hypothetical protein
LVTYQNYFTYVAVFSFHLRTCLPRSLTGILFLTSRIRDTFLLCPHYLIRHDLAK